MLTPTLTPIADPAAAEFNIADAFRRAVGELSADLSLTFPEWTYLWTRWTADSPEEDMRALFAHCRAVFPASLDSIMSQNAAIFSPDSDANTEFLPDVQFKALFFGPGVSDSTRAALWRHLRQLALLTAVSGPSGDDADMYKKLAAAAAAAAAAFDGSDQAEMHEKLKDAVKNVFDFFPATESDDARAAGGAPEGTAPGIPGLDGLLDGKIGALVKELAEDISGDLAALLGKTPGAADGADGADVLKGLMADPSKMAELVKSIGAKISGKMASGEVSHEELAREADAMMEKMRGIGGDKFYNMISTMFGAANGAPGAKRPPQRAPERAPSGASGSMRDRLRARVAQKHALAYINSVAAAAEGPPEAAAAVLRATQDAHKFVYSVDGSETQEVSPAAQASGGEAKAPKKRGKGKK